jgi:hypothetical protein
MRHLALGEESAIAQPKATYGGTELYPTPVEKAAALCFSLVLSHPFVDGNKRMGPIVPMPSSDPEYGEAKQASRLALTLVCGDERNAHPRCGLECKG